MDLMPKDVVDAVVPASGPEAPEAPKTSKVPAVNRLRRPPRQPAETEAAARVGQSGRELEAKLKSERVELRLKAMPQWRRTLEGKAITRVKDLPSLEAATMYSAFAISLAESANLPVNVNAAGSRVIITLYPCRTRGRHTNLTEAVLDLAEQIG
jgi:hypothetical protein